MDMKFKRAVDIIRNLRNDFAHATQVEALSMQEYADKLRALLKLMKKGNEDLFDQFLPFFEQEGIHGEHARNYSCCVMILLLKLELVQNSLSPPDIMLPALLDYKNAGRTA